MNLEVPLVSIVIPTYNAQATIKETLLSVLNQSYENIVIYIVDDCSNDNTLNIVHSIADAKIHIIESKENIGFCANWNRALSFCKGKYFKLLPHDDTLEKKSIEKMVEVMQKNQEIVLVGSFRNIINEKSDVVMQRGELIYSRNISTYDEVMTKVVSCATNPIGEPGSVLIRTDIIKENSLKFSDRYELFIDVDFYMKLLKYGKCYILNEPLSNFRVWSSSYSVKNQKQQLEDTKIFFKEIIKEHPALSKYTLLLNKISIYKNYFLKRVFYRFVVR